MTPELLEALARPQVQRWFHYRLTPTLETEMERESREWRLRMLRRWMLADFAFSWLGCLLQGLQSQHWALPVSLRLLLLTPLVLLSNRALQPGCNARWETPAAVLPHCVALNIALVELLSNGPAQFMTAVTVLCLGCFWINSLTPMRLHDTLLFTLVTMGIGDALLAAFAARVAVAPGVVTIPFHVIVALSVLARFFAERDLRRTFLSGLALRRRADELARSNDALLTMANTDPLTGLSNRRNFDRRFAQLWGEASAGGEELAVIMIDVDHFKTFNDSAGHLEGDRCLAVVAKAIAGQVRAGCDVAARFGGEEFIVLTPQAGEAEAMATAERIRVAIEALQIFHPSRPDGRFVSVSVGVASARPRADGDPAKLIGAADAALYAAKQAGRGQALAHRPPGERCAA